MDIQINKKPFWQLLITTSILVVLMPLPRLGCFDGCEWQIAPLFSSSGLGGIFFVWPLLIPSAFYGIFYLSLLWITNQLSWITRSKIRWYVNVVAIALIGVFSINAYTIHFNKDVRDIYESLKSRYLVLPRITIGMTREEVLRLYPDAVPKDSVYVSFDTEDFFIHREGGLQDCLSFSGTYSCFKEDRVYITIAPRVRKYGGTGEIHDDYSSTLKKYTLSDLEVCNRINTAPWYMGYPDVPGCFRALAKSTGDDTFCLQASGVFDKQCLENLGWTTGRLEVCEKIGLKEKFSYQDKSEYYRDLSHYNMCILHVADKQNDVAICEKLIHDDDRKQQCITIIGGR